MANPNAPFGFRLLGVNRGGAPVTGALVPRKIAAANAVAIFRGDLVQSLATGYISQSAPGVAVSQAAGIFWGVEYFSQAAGRKVFSTTWPTGDHPNDGDALILPISGIAPNLFYIQATSTNFTFADIGENCDISVGTGTAAGGNGRSGMTLDRGTINVTNTLPFRIVDMYSSMVPAGTPGTDDTSNFNLVVVAANSLNATGI